MTATVTISVEVELAWGFHDKRGPAAIPELSGDGSAERAALRRLLALCDEFEVPITFDVVGHLLLDSCTGRHDGPHPQGWFDRDPGTDARTDPLFYAPETVDWISEAAVDHEIGTHTFSHVLCDEVGPAVVDWELSRVDELHDEPILSFVSPRHRNPPRDVLQEHGIQVLRLPTGEEELPSGAVSRFRFMLEREHPIELPGRTNGIVETHTSPLMTLTSTTLSRGVASPHPAFRLLPGKVRRRIHAEFLTSGLKRAVGSDGFIHYWTHLYNLANDAQWPPIHTFFAMLASAVSSDEAVVKPMRDLR